MEEFEGGYTNYDYYAGLFGMVGGGSATIANVTLDDAYITSGSYAAGGIIGHAQGRDSAPVVVKNCVSYAVVDSGGANSAGGIVGSGVWTNIRTCVNYGSVYGYGHEDGEGVGGIVGKVDDSGHLTYGNVVDCVNYGSVSGYAYHTGGIAGYVIVGRIVNSANFGAVHGGNDCVGGITGEHSNNANAKTMNCVNFAEVTGSTGKYVGTVIGRNYDNKGTVGPVYYYTEVAGSMKAAGTKNGSSDDVDNLTAIRFSSIDSTLQSNLNGWSYDDYDGTAWVKVTAPGLVGFIPESVYELLNEN